MTAPNGCRGDCCVAFYVPTHKDDLASTPTADFDVATMKDMLIPLTRRQVRDRRAKFGVKHTPMSPDAEGYLYKCRHWDEDTRLCKIYAQRPKMCRDFPYEKPCGYGCSHRPERDIIQSYIAKRVAEKARPQ